MYDNFGEGVVILKDLNSSDNLIPHLYSSLEWLSLSSPNLWQTFVSVHKKLFKLGQNFPGKAATGQLVQKLLAAANMICNSNFSRRNKKLNTKPEVQHSKY